MSKHPKTYEQFQKYYGEKYSVAGLIAASQGLEVVELEVKYICADYGIAQIDSISKAAELYQRIKNADLSYPILMSPDGFILDRKHRLTKARAERVEKIKVIRFDEMPAC